MYRELWVLTATRISTIFLTEGKKDYSANVLSFYIEEVSLAKQRQQTPIK